MTVVIGGAVSATIKYDKQPKSEHKPIQIKWANFILFWGVLIGVAILGALTKERLILLFENFYRNGAFIYGGGQVLIPVMLTEFVKVKEYLTQEEFLSGFALSQLVPGPVFSFTAFIGVLSMREWGLGGQLVGALVASAGIFLPGTFMIFFVYRFWDELKKYRVIKASLDGINGASAGLVVAAAILLLEPQGMYVLNTFLVFATVAVLIFTKIPHPYIILAGLLAGLVWEIFV